MPLVIERRQEPAYAEVNNLDETPEVGEEPLYTEILRYIKTKEYPSNSSKRAKQALRLLASH